MIRIVASMILFAGLVGLASAGNPYPAVQYQQQYAAPAVVAVPVYTAVYSPADAELAAEVKALREEVQSLRAEVQALRAPPLKLPVKKASVKAPTLKPDPLAIVSRSCAACHSPTMAAEKGFGFVLFADSGGQVLAPLTPQEKLRAALLVQGGSMPKGSRLTAPEKSALVEFFSRK